MSYDICLRSVECPTCHRRDRDEPEEHNPTYNLTPIFDLALTGEPLPNPELGEFEVVIFRKEADRPRGLRILNGRTGADSVPMIVNALKRLRDPAWRERFRVLEPANGWGTYADSITVFEYLLKDAQEHLENVWWVQ